MAPGLVFDLQRFSLHDGPGIRTTVFLKGCPLSCLWCHNPESQLARPELLVRRERCIGCEACVEACPLGLPVPLAGRGAEDRESCLVCGECAAVCPTGAREVAGREVAPEELVAELLRDRLFFEDSGGGVTFSGGEPLSQAPFLLETLELCRREALHRVVDTSGLAPESVLLEVARLTDLFLFDVKVVDGDRHRALTGVDNGTILSNLAALSAAGKRIWLRVPVVPGCNDDRENLEATAALAARLASVEKVCLLPYHPIGESKRERLGATSRPRTPPLPQEMARHRSLFEAAGLRTQIGG